MALAAPAAAAVPPSGVAHFTVRNTGTAAAVDNTAHPSDPTGAVGYDIYRLTVAVDGQGWTSSLQNALAAVKFGASATVPVLVAQGAGSAASATVTLKAVSESDPAKTATATWTVRGR